MSAKHPIIAVTGSSGAGTTSVTRTFNWIFRRERINAALVEGDSFHRYNRLEMKQKNGRGGRTGRPAFQPLRPGEQSVQGARGAVPRLRRESGRGKIRRYLHNEKEAQPYKQEPGTFTEWQEIPKDTDLLFYEGLHGAVVTPEVNVARHADLIIGVVPIINLEWIQKLHRDKDTRGYSTEAVVDTILRRMPDYVNYICPQFSQTHVNFQRVPTVDTSNPFTARYIPAADESFVVIRFANPKGIDFPYLLSMVHDSFMSRPNIIVCPGRQDGARHAAHPDADDLEAHGCAPPRARRAAAAGARGHGLTRSSLGRSTPPEPRINLNPGAPRDRALRHPGNPRGGSAEGTAPPTGVPTTDPSGRVCADPRSDSRRAAPARIWEAPSANGLESNSPSTAGLPSSRRRIRLTIHGFSLMPPRAANHICQSSRGWCGMFHERGLVSGPGL